MVIPLEFENEVDYKDFLDAVGEDE